jgi:hypothetical protein
MAAEKEYTAREVARLLGLAYDTIRAYCARGTVNGYKKTMYTLTTSSGKKLHFPEGVEVWYISESELKRLKKERGIKSNIS